VRGSVAETEMSVRKEQAGVQGKLTSVAVCSAAGAGNAGGTSEGSWGASNVVVCCVVIGSCGDEASDISSDLGVVPTST